MYQLISDAKKLNSITIFIQLSTLVPTKLIYLHVFLASVFNVEASKDPHLFILLCPPSKWSK